MLLSQARKKNFSNRTCTCIVVSRFFYRRYVFPPALPPYRAGVFLAPRRYVYLGLHRKKILIELSLLAMCIMYWTCVERNIAFLTLPLKNETFTAYISLLISRHVTGATTRCITRCFTRYFRRVRIFLSVFYIVICFYSHVFTFAKKLFGEYTKFSGSNNYQKKDSARGEVAYFVIDATRSNSHNFVIGEASIFLRKKTNAIIFAADRKKKKSAIRNRLISLDHALIPTLL
ncbi:hypothetical protein PUN28_020247 [Cardiocondyla obscurior]|uniref:Uncharacterized protein n=1 Tax=Cardiocondyla obscurior TaxID=286306 RepID=A0AAW2E9L5_9HYME